jgi:hypothetical protein
MGNTVELYIGNATRQYYTFNFRSSDTITKDGNHGYKQQRIPPGSQVKIAWDFEQRDIDHIVQTKTKYGMIHESKIGTLVGGFQGICYSVDKPIDRVKLRYLFQHNLDALVDMGREIREQCAVAQNAFLEQTLRQNGATMNDGLEITLQQEKSDESRSTEDVSESLRVTANPDAPPRAPNARRRG